MSCNLTVIILEIQKLQEYTYALETNQIQSYYLKQKFVIVSTTKNVDTHTQIVSICKLN